MSDDLETYEVEVDHGTPQPLAGVELRDAIASDYRRNMWRTRRELISRADAEAQAAADCNLVDRFESDVKRGIPTAPAKAEPKLDQAHAAAEKQGATLVKREATGQSQGLPEPASVLSREKAAALVTRLAILGGHTNGQLHYPKWANKVREEYINCGLGRRQYRFCVTPWQRARVFARRLEDIADQSNSIPGLPSWWVK